MDGTEPHAPHQPTQNTHTRSCKRATVLIHTIREPNRDWLVGWLVGQLSSLNFTWSARRGRNKPDVYGTTALIRGACRTHNEQVAFVCHLFIVHE